MPALMLLGGVAVREAVGTSLLVIAMNAFAGLAGSAAHAQRRWLDRRDGHGARDRGGAWWGRGSGAGCPRIICSGRSVGSCSRSPPSILLRGARVTPRRSSADARFRSFHSAAQPAEEQCADGVGTVVACLDSRGGIMELTSLFDHQPIPAASRMRRDLDRALTWRCKPRPHRPQRPPSERLLATIERLDRRVERVEAALSRLEGATARIPADRRDHRRRARQRRGSASPRVASTSTTDCGAAARRAPDVAACSM